MDNRTMSVGGRPPAAAGRVVRAGSVSVPANRWWLILQGDVLELVESDSEPDLTTVRGERRKRNLGSFPDKASAEARYEVLSPRAKGIVGKGVAY